MKKLIFKCLLLILPFAIILSFVEYKLRRTPNTYQSSKTALEKGQNEFEILTTGASHTANGILPEFFDRPAFNLANGSQTLYYDTQLVNKYSGKMPKLKIVIFTISYHSLETQLKNSMEYWRSGFYKQVHNIPREEEEAGFQIADYSYIGLYTPKLAYKIVLEDLLQKNNSSENALIKSENQVNVNSEFGKRRAKLHETEMRDSSIPINVEYLEQSCRLLAEKNITVVFLTIPTHSTYYDNINQKKYQGMQETIKQLSEKHKIEYFNYMLDPRFKDTDFIDSDHLNKVGAEKFTKIINQEIIRKYL